MRGAQTVLALVWCLAVVTLPGAAQQVPPGTGAAAARGEVLAIGNLTGPEIGALSRDSTLFLLSVGMLEWHGPHLPIAADLIGVKYEAERVADRLSRALPGWNVVVMPDINYGSTGVNHVGNMPIHPGTYGIRQSTLRSLVADIGAQIVQNRFKWVFVMNGHGAPPHAMAVNDACDFVSEVFNATMLNVSALFKADSAIQSKANRLAAEHFSPADLSSFGMDVHAGVSETSGILAIRPDLVRSTYRTLPSYRAGNPEEMREIALRPDWRGYFSSPARANASYGRAIEMWWVEGMTDLILRAVRGENMLTYPRFPGDLRNDSVRLQLVEDVLHDEREFELKLERWLAQRRKP
jgi:creatinine amidohydrolase